MIWNRRDFITASSLGLVSAVGGRALFAQTPAAQPAPAVPEFKDVRGSVGVFTARGGTIGYLVMPDAVVVVDSQFPDTAPMFLDGLKPKTSRTIDLLINSHHHGDHTGGNKVMQPSVAKIVAHATSPVFSASRRQRRKTEANQAAADMTFEKDLKTAFGDETITGATTPGAQRRRTSSCSRTPTSRPDPLSYQRHPRADRPAGRVDREPGARARTVVSDQSADTIYIFGHAKAGERVTGSGKDLLELRDYFTAMLDFTRKAIAAGRPMEEVVKTAAIPGFERYEGTPTALQAAYDELKS